MKRLAVLILLMLLLAGAGGAAWWFLLRADPAEDGAEAETEFELTSTVRFVELEPMNLPIIREGRVILHLALVVAVELSEPIPTDMLSRISPPLRDALFSELHAIYALRYVQERGYDLPFVRERLIRAGERALGAGAVKSILIQNIAKRVPS